MCALRAAAAALSASHAALASACEAGVSRRVAEFHFRGGKALEEPWRIWRQSVNLCAAACVFRILWGATEGGCEAAQSAALAKASAAPGLTDARAAAMTPNDSGLRRRRPAAVAQRASPDVEVALALLRGSSARETHHHDDAEMPQSTALPQAGPLHLLRAMRRVIVNLDRRFDDAAVRDEDVAAFSLRCAAAALELRMASFDGLRAAAAVAPPRSRSARAALRCRLAGCWCVHFAFVLAASRAVKLAAEFSRFWIRRPPLRIASAGWSVALAALDKPALAVVLDALLSTSALVSYLLVFFWFYGQHYGWSSLERSLERSLQLSGGLISCLTCGVMAVFTARYFISSYNARVALRIRTRNEGVPCDSLLFRIDIFCFAVGCWFFV